MCGSIKAPRWVITTIQLDRAALLLYDILVITHHPVAEPLSLFRDIITTANGIVYRWNKEPKKEILIQNTPIQHLKLPKSYKKTVNPLHNNTTSYQYDSLTNVKNST